MSQEQEHSEKAEQDQAIFGFGEAEAEIKRDEQEAAQDEEQVQIQVEAGDETEKPEAGQDIQVTSSDSEQHQQVEGDLISGPLINSNGLVPHEELPAEPLPIHNNAPNTISPDVDHEGTTSGSATTNSQEHLLPSTPNPEQELRETDQNGERGPGPVINGDESDPQNGAETTRLKKKRRGVVLPKTLNPDEPFVLTKPRQFSAVFLKNYRLQMKSWVTLVVFYVVTLLFVCLAGFLYIFLGGDDEASLGGRFNAPEGKYSRLPRNNKNVGPALTWVAPAIRSEGLFDRTGVGECEKDSMLCTGMLATINAPQKYKSTSSGQLSMRYPYNESLSVTDWELYPSFQQEDLSELVTFNAAQSAANEILKNQLIGIREAGFAMSENPWDDIYPWALLYNKYQGPSENVYVPATGESSDNEHTYKMVQDFKMIVPRKNQNILTEVPDNFIMDCLTVLNAAYDRFNLVNQDGTNPNRTFSYVVENITWRTLPYIQYDNSDAENMAEQAGAYIYPFAFIIFLPSFIYNIVNEKGLQLRAMHDMVGLRSFPRLTATILWEFIIMIGAGIIFIGISFAFGLHFVTETFCMFYILATLAFCVVIPGHAAFLSTFFNSSRVSALMGLLIIIIEVVFFDVFSSGEGNQGHNLAWNVWPFFGVLAAFREISDSVISNDPDMHLSSKYFTFNSNGDHVNYTRGMNIILDSILSIIITFIWVPVGVYLEHILPKTYGVRDSWLFLFAGIVRRAWQVEKRIGTLSAEDGFNPELSLSRVFHAIHIYFKYWNIARECGKKEKELVRAELYEANKTLAAIAAERRGMLLGAGQPSISSATESEHMPLLSPTASKDSSTAGGSRTNFDDFGIGEIDPIKDKDLAAEIQRTQLGTTSYFGAQPLVRVMGLKKVYPASGHAPPKQAVKGIYFSIGDSECLGMLGPNGAGKTTTVSMLCGMFKPSGGTALICEHDMLDPGTRILIQRQLGVCPQFDVVWPKLTVREHLEFYAALKGVPKEYQEEHILDLASAVGLSTQVDVPAHALSGGMLRRLSVAIALTGRPRVVILDEPTTGLDPATRRSLWNIVLAVRKSRAMLLTTHSMEEAEALCNRIGIVSQGQLWCIGTQAHLKKRFGSGVKITVCVDNTTESIPQDEDAVPEEVPPLIVHDIYLTKRNEQIAHQRVLGAVGTELILTSAYCGTLTYSLPKQNARDRIATVFKNMEVLCRDPSSHITDWGVCQTSLESVFLNIVAASTNAQFSNK